MRLDQAEMVQAFLRRTLATVAGRTPQTPTSYRDLRAIDELRALVNVMEHELIEQARDAGLSWSSIGGLLKCSKQAAQQRFSRVEL